MNYGSSTLFDTETESRSSEPMIESSHNSVPKTAHRLFLLATIFTWPLLFVGGLVTTYRVGMAVPDWPTTFGINMFRYNFLNSAWGVFIEHGHRLYGSAVGLCLLIVAPWVQCLKKVPPRFKAAAWVALLGVIFQGIMGGLRVTQNSTQLAMFHGCFAQLFFAYLACLCWCCWHCYAPAPSRGPMVPVPTARKSAPTRT